MLGANLSRPMYQHSAVLPSMLQARGRGGARGTRPCVRTVGGERAQWAPPKNCRTAGQRAGQSAGRDGRTAGAATARAHAHSHAHRERRARARAGPHLAVIHRVPCTFMLAAPPRGPGTGTLPMLNWHELLFCFLPLFRLTNCDIVRVRVKQKSKHQSGSPVREAVGCGRRAPWSLA